MNRFFRLTLSVIALSEAVRAQQCTGLPDTVSCAAAYTQFVCNGFLNDVDEECTPQVTLCEQTCDTVPGCGCVGRQTDSFTSVISCEGSVTPCRLFDTQSECISQTGCEWEDSSPPTPAAKKPPTAPTTATAPTVDPPVPGQGTLSTLEIEETSSSSSTPVGAIVGGVVGGAVIAIFAFIALKMSRTSPNTPSEGKNSFVQEDAVHQPVSNQSPHSPGSIGYHLLSAVREERSTVCLYHCIAGSLILTAAALL